MTVKKYSVKQLKKMALQFNDFKFKEVENEIKLAKKYLELLSDEDSDRKSFEEKGFIYLVSHSMDVLYARTRAINFINWLEEKEVLE